MDNLEVILKNLDEKGYYIIENYYTEDRCDKIVKEIKNHFPKNFIKEDKSESKGGDYRMKKSEMFFNESKEFLSDPMFRTIADTYIGKPLMDKRCQIGVVQHQDGFETNSGGGWHVDSHDKQFKAIMYLTDVDENSGYFSIVENSRNMIKDLGTTPAFAGDKSQTRILESKVFESFDQDRIKKMTAKKGTVILVDTSNIHRGTNIKSGERISYTNYYYHKK